MTFVIKGEASPLNMLDMLDMKDRGPLPRLMVQVKVVRLNQASYKVMARTRSRCPLRRCLRRNVESTRSMSKDKTNANAFAQSINQTYTWLCRLPPNAESIAMYVCVY